MTCFVQHRKISFLIRQSQQKANAFGKFCGKASLEESQVRVFQYILIHTTTFLTCSQSLARNTLIKQD